MEQGLDRRLSLDRRLVAVMFTDMVGYTALLGSDESMALKKRDRFMDTVERHHATFGGTIVQRLGDGTLSTFPSSLACVQAAIATQRELADQNVAARIGIHVGEVIVEATSLSGSAVNIASRIESFAVPGGVMLSDTVRDQLANRGDVDLVSLGRFRLKNVGRPMELFAVSADGIVVPDPRALDGKGERFASLPSNLPDLEAPIIGRATDLDSIVESTRKHRVVTITGPGGVGKTRILVEIGRMLASEFLDGVSFVALADVSRSEDFLQAVSDALDVKEADDRTVAEGLVALVDDKKALLLLDNLEQIVDAAPDVARLVASCPNLRVVTTSRTPLRIAAEREYPLRPLPLPASSDSDPAVVIGYPAVAFFVDRARTTKGSFALTAENGAAVVAICRRLDGLPLALELAAARLRILSPQGLLERLDHALNLLTSGQRDAVGRHQTLRATIDWSHQLLSEYEQRLFRRMAVFIGGFALADVEAVCADPDGSSLDDLESLVGKALVQPDASGDRFRMLQTIGEYARERLDASGEAGDIALRHAGRYGDVARGIRDGIEGTNQIGALEQGIADEGNLVAALDTFLTRAREGDATACESGMQMCGDLYFYWHIRGKNITAREYAAAFLAADTARTSTVGRAAALINAGLGSWILGEFQRAADEWSEAYRIAEERDAHHESCKAAFFQGLALLGINLEAASRWTVLGVEAGRTMGFTWGEALASTFDGIVHAVAGDADGAQTRYSHGLAIQERLGDREGAGVSLGGLAALAARGGDLAQALELYGRSLAAFETIGDRAEEARILAETAWTYLRDGRSVQARRYFVESVQAYTEVGSVRGVGLSLIGLAATEAAEDRPLPAVQIAAAAEVHAAKEGIVNVYSDETPGREIVDRARASLPSADAARAVEVGGRLTIRQALDLARIGESLTP